MRFSALFARAFFLVARAMTLVVVIGLLTTIANAQGAGYWHTSGAQIYDSNNQPVRIAGINWYGFETTDAVVHGLTSQDYKAILRTIQTQGYNTVRIPFSNQMVETPSSNLNISYYNNFGPINTDLQGLNSLQILDKIVTYAGSIGLKIILDNHRSEAGNSAESNGLWYTSSYPESNWIADWQMLAARYAGNPTVIGFDLRNEPHNAYSGGACWDCGGANDWHLAAERGGNAVQAINPNLLIFVEGTDAYNNDYYWWGGNLEGVSNSPLTLSVPNHLVYSAHDYGPNEYGQSWFNNDSQASLDGVWTTHWGYISQQGIAPVWLGEFGTENSDSDVSGSASGSQGLWFQSLVGYLKAKPALNWTYWALNGEDSYGLLDSNYDPTPVSASKQSSLATIQFALSPGTTSASAPNAPTGMTAATVSSSQINLTWAASTSSGVSYTIFFGTSAGSVGTVLASGVTGTSYPATGLNASTTYYFDVMAVSASGGSAVSNTASATTQAPATTAAPSGLSANAISASQINLAWLAGSAGSFTYNVYSGSSAGSISNLVASGLTSTTYSATGLSAGTTYYFAVTASATTGTSAPSSPASATTQPPAPPSAPSGLTATATSSSQINLAWSGSSTAGVSYSIYSGSNLIASGVSGTSYSVTGLAANTSYTFTVTAVANGSASSASNAASATTQAAPPPSAPTSLTASAVSSSQINLWWAASSTAGVTYNVYNGSNLIANGLSGTSYSVTGLAASTSYTFTVTAVANGAASSASNPASATTQAPPPPSAPSSLNASVISSSQINLSWTASPTAGVTYSVYTGSSLIASGVGVTSYSVTGLSPSTSYSFTVTAVANGVASAASNIASATTQAPPPPSAPSSLTATAVSSSQINLSWAASSTAGVTYNIYSGSNLIASGISGTSYSITGLAASTSYSFTVTAVSAAGSSAGSNTASATTQAATATAPAAPSGLSASTFSASQVNLTWQPSTTSGVTYIVYIGTASGATNSLAASGITSTSYSVTGLLDGTSYYFTVKAVSSSGVASAASNQASATTQTLPPTPPTGLAATAVSATQVNLSWTAVPNTGATYAVYYGTISGAENTLVASGINGTSYQATGLSASTTYYFIVRSVSTAGTSAPSAEASATTQSAGVPVVPVTPPSSPTVPTAPSGLVASAVSSTQINLTWSPSSTSNVTYNVYFGSSAGTISTLLASGLGATSFSATGLTASTSYYFAVTAVNSAGASPASNAASATTQAPPAPSAPTGLAATASSASQINLSWSASTTSGVTYSVYSGTASGAETNLLASGLSGTSYAATGLSASTTYYYIVKAVSGTTSSTASNEASATTQAATSGGCHVSYQDQNDWGFGFTGALTITNNSSTTMTSWTVSWTYSGNQQLYTSWDGNYTQSGQTVTISNAAWNGTIAPGATVSGIGWNANYSGSNANPVTFYVNGVACK